MKIIIDSKQFIKTKVFENTSEIKHVSFKNIKFNTVLLDRTEMYSSFIFAFLSV